MLKIQKNINETGPEEFRNLRVISDAELNEIRRIWLEEKHEFHDVLPKIYREVMGHDLKTQYCRKAPFGEEEWELLKNVVDERTEQAEKKEELAFELAYRLIDVESSYSSLQKRKGIYTSLQAEIKRCYYRDEEDATAFAMGRERRKKDLGLDYDTDVNLTDDLMDDAADSQKKETTDEN